MSRQNPIRETALSRGITIADVARDAGVSVATVSRALRDLPSVAPSTKQRIQQVAESLHYQPDPSASALAAGRTRTVAVLVPTLDSWYFSRVTAGAETVLAPAGYDLLLHSFGASPTSTPTRFTKRADGILVVGREMTPEESHSMTESNTAVVAVGAGSNILHSVDSDDSEMTRMAVQHLIDLGHRRIGLIAGGTGDTNRPSVPERRIRSYVTTLAEAGIDPAAELRVDGTFSIDNGYQGMAQLLELDKPPTAVLAMSDRLAFGALEAASSRSVHIPDDISIIGLDDHEFSRVVGLTTVSQNIDDHGVIAANIMLELLRQRLPSSQSTSTPTNAEYTIPISSGLATTKPTSFSVPLKLIQRRSTAPPRHP